MKFTTVSALALGVAFLTGCGGGNNDDTGNQGAEGRSLAAIERAANQTPRSDRADQSEIEALIAALEDDWIITVESYGSARGGAVAEGFRMAHRVLPSVGLAAEEVHFWGIDTGALSSFGNGNSESVELADRIEMLNTEYFGFDELSTDIEEALLDMVPDTMDIEPTQYDTYETNMARMIMDGLTIHDVGEVPSIDSIDSGWAAADALASMVLYSSADLWYMEDYTAEFSSTDELGMRMDLSTSAPVTAYLGFDRGNLDYSVMSGLTADIDMAAPASPEMAAMTVSMSYDIDLIEASDIKLVPLLEHIAEQQLPPTEETDLLSFGLHRVEGLSFSVNDEALFGMETMTLDLTESHWLLPTDITADVDAVSISLRSFWDFIASFGEATNDAEFESIVPIAEDVLSVLESYDLETMVVDYDFNMNWNPESGASGLSYTQVLRNEFGEEYDISGALPTYEAMVPALNALMADGDASLFEPLFTENSSFNSGRLTYSEQGFIGKLFAVATEFGEYVPDDTDMPQLLMLKNADPEQLRAGVAGLLTLASAGIAAQVPAAAGWTASLAAFIQQGGEFEVLIQPPVPVSQASVEAFMMEMGGMPTPDQIIDFVGVTVEHRPPAE